MSNTAKRVKFHHSCLGEKQINLLDTATSNPWTYNLLPLAPELKGHRAVLLLVRLESRRRGHFQPLPLRRCSEFVLRLGVGDGPVIGGRRRAGLGAERGVGGGALEAAHVEHRMVSNRP